MSPVQPHMTDPMGIRKPVWNPHGHVRCSLDWSYGCFQARKSSTGTRTMPARVLTEPVGYTYVYQSPTGPETPVGHM